MRNILLGACEEVVDAEDIVSLIEQSFTQVRTKKPGSAGNKNFLHVAETTIQLMK
jgi:hypothetical protein